MKPNPPLVTVITPTYNRAMLLKETAESIFAQFYPSIEYVIVDDGSTDNTENVVAALSPRKGHRVQFVKQPRSGEAAAINHGWQLANGEYVAVVSSDDPQPPDWLSTCVGYLEKYQTAVAGYPDWTMLGASGEPYCTVSLPAFDRAAMIETVQCYPGPGTLIRRSLVKDAELRRAGFLHCSDFDCWLRLSLCGDFVHIPVTAAAWRSHPNGFSAANGIVWYEDMKKILRDFFARPDLPEDIRALQRVTEANMRYEAARKIWRQNPLLGLALLVRSFRLPQQGRRHQRYWPKRWRP